MINCINWLITRYKILKTYLYIKCLVSILSRYLYYIIGGVLYQYTYNLLYIILYGIDFLEHICPIYYPTDVEYHIFDIDEKTVQNRVRQVPKLRWHFLWHFDMPRLFFILIPSGVLRNFYRGYI